MPTIQEWSKSPEGVELIESQRVFCIDGVLWQGFKKAAIRVDEGQLADEELDKVHDIDGM